MKTKKIVPVTIWSEGKSRKASLLSVIGEHDDYDTSCTLYYELLEDVRDEQDNFIYTGNLASGRIDFAGEDYAKWDGDNEYPFIFVSEKLDLKLIEE
jgi:hypothetical protein